MEHLPEVNRANGLQSPMGNGINLQFAFNERSFSDRLLHLEIMADSLPSDGSDHTTRIKQKRDLIEGDVAQRKTVHVISAILAAGSLYFYKLFTNGMRESTKRDVTLKINASEEIAFMDILKCMYTNTLRATSTADLLNVLMVANKFEVPTCVKYCIELLQNKPMSLESAMSYIQLPTTSSMDKAILPLIEKSKQYIIQTFGNLVKSEEKAMQLSLGALKVVLSCNGIKVESEDHVYNFIVKWGRANYPEVRERQQILTKHLARYIYLPFMSPHKLEELLGCDDFVREDVTKLVLKALHCSAGYLYGQEFLLSPTNSPRRSYTYYPVKVLHFESHRGEAPRCFVYLYLRRDEVKSLYPSEQRFSQSFVVAGRWFCLKVACDSEQEEFGLYLKMFKGSEMCSVDYEFAVMKTTTAKEFQSVYRITSSSLKPGSYRGKLNLFKVPWFYFIGRNSHYFVNGILHFRVEITVNSSP